MIPEPGARPILASPAGWRARGRVLALDRPIIFGIVNVTPDSFSDGGRFFSPDAAVEHGARLLEEGADGLDIGGESTRPQSPTPVDVDEERRRVLPVLAVLRARFPETYLSVDTVKSEVAAAALGEGADIINDVSGLRLDARMADVCARMEAGVVLMHSRGTVTDMASFAHATYGRGVVDEMMGELASSVDAARAAGVSDSAIVLDPGIGFAKCTADSLAVLASIDRIAALGFPVMVGVSRKRFIGELSGVAVPAERLEGGIGANVMALAAGARIFRVHDVGPTRRALAVAWPIVQLRIAT